jgi:chromosome segregation ATPase
MNDIKCLERDELVELIGELGSNLSDRIVHEQALRLRIKGLERALDGTDGISRKTLQSEINVRIAAEDRAIKLEMEKDDLEMRIEELSDNSAWERLVEDYEKTKDRIKVLEEANESLGDRLEVALAETNGLAHELIKTRGYLESSKSTRQIKNDEIKRLEKELRENRTNVMNELSAMIPKAVEAEREACAAVCRQAALQCASPINADAIMEVVNAIKERGK